MSDNKDKTTDMAVYMSMAYQAAQEALARDEVPIGAVIVHHETGEIISSASNRTRELNDPTAHAEILAIKDACQKMGAQRIPDMDLYVTLEPCPMCAAAISFARIKTVIFGASDPKSGGVVSGPTLYDSPAMHHKPKVESGVMAEECGHIISDFFKSKRSAKNQNREKD